MTPVLECHDLAAGYGPAPVVRDVNLAVCRGTILAVLGPNGAGKTSLLLAIAGFLPRQAGSVRLGGRELPSGRAGAANRAGVVLVPDDRALFTSLSVAENLEAAHVKGSRPVRELLEFFPALERRWHVQAGALSGGEQQMLAIARGLLREPKVLLIDEMSMGLAPTIAEELLGVIRELSRSAGVAVVLVEQHVQLALETADSALVLVHGQVALRAASAELRLDRDRLEAAYFGAPASI